MKIINCFLMMKRIFRLAVIITMVFANYSSFASCGSAFSGHFVVRQETVRDGSVLVCRPSELDLRIIDLIKNNNITSLEEYSAWLEKNIQYRADGENDEWALPQETLGRLYGDCEDYALLNVAVLRVLGYESKIVILGTSEKEHAICVFEKNGNFLWFDNAELKYTDAVTMGRFKQYMFEKYACSHVTELKLRA
ncbi:MAG: transglutaminase-like domain-containing protein [Candidatus Omnitrophota bacterium]|nr:transglutaminase-like domain-containing protein [Candidatus Omnitrophota bacterium]MBU1894188.1 transglutaminase-like domain-containing protein [Candidatus Omnitrophota bacterium]